MRCQHCGAQCSSKHHLEAHLLTHTHDELQLTESSAIGVTELNHEVSKDALLKNNLIQNNADGDGKIKTNISTNVHEQLIHNESEARNTDNIAKSSNTFSNQNLNKYNFSRLPAFSQLKSAANFEILDNHTSVVSCNMLPRKRKESDVEICIKKQNLDNPKLKMMKLSKSPHEFIYKKGTKVQNTNDIESSEIEPNIIQLTDPPTVFESFPLDFGEKS